MVVIRGLGFVVVTVSGASRGWVLGSLAVAALVVVALTTGLLSDHRKDWLTAFADPSADPKGLGHQTRRVCLAIGSGGWWGAGYLSGQRTQRGTIPYLRRLLRRGLHTRLVGGSWAAIALVDCAHTAPPTRRHPAPGRGTGPSQWRVRNDVTHQ